MTTLYTKRPNNALLGLTATPGRTWDDIDADQALSDFFDGNKLTLKSEGYEDPIRFLIEQKFLAKPSFRTLISESHIDDREFNKEGLESSVEVPDSVLNQLGRDAITERKYRFES